MRAQQVPRVTVTVDVLEMDTTSMQCACVSSHRSEAVSTGNVRGSCGMVCVGVDVVAAVAAADADTAGAATLGT